MSPTSGAGATAVATTAKPRIEVRELPFRLTAVVRETIAVHRLTDELGRIYELVMLAIGRQGLAAVGPPFARYLGVRPLVDVEAGIPLAQLIEPEGEVVSGELPEGPAIRAVHLGDITDLPTAYAAIDKFRAENGLVEIGAAWESYVTDRSTTLDPQQWRTEIFVPVAYDLGGLLDQTAR